MNWDLVRFLHCKAMNDHFEREVELRLRDEIKKVLKRIKDSLSFQQDNNDDY